LDSINNVNVHKRIEGSWYNGPCLLELLNTIQLPERKPMGPLRMPIIDKFKEVGNLYLYGKVESGTIIEDQTITILPSRTQAVIKEIFNAKDERLPFAMAGENVKMRMKGIDEGDTKRG
jgi:peptide chain release factor subunit 3